MYAKFGGFLRNYSGNDVPSAKIEFLDINGTLLGTTSKVSNTTAAWLLVERADEIPFGTRTLRYTLEAIRNSGNDNDCYFDNLYLLLQQGLPCSAFNECPASINLTNPIHETALTVQVQDYIFSTTAITGASIIKYKAGENITLENGFCTSIGVDFEALIENCQ